MAKGKTSKTAGQTDGVSLTNVGPIEGTFTIDCSAGPGLYELQGGKGRGKSTVLSALNLIAGHKVQLTVHDGELSGAVEGFGVVVPVGSRKRRKGELELASLDSDRYEIADLIDPPGKTAETRDATRIKVLAQLSGVELSEADFHDLVGGADRFAKLGVDASEDALTLCTRVKASIEAAARQQESIADRELGRAEALRTQIEGVDLDVEADPAALAAAAEKSAAELSALQERRTARENAKQERETAQQRLQQAEAAYDGPTVEEATKIRDEASEALQKARDALAEAERLVGLRISEAGNSEQQLRAAQQHAATVATWRETLAGTLPEPVTDAELHQAQEALQSARQAQETGVRVRDARKAAASADEARESAKQARRYGDRLREVAAGVWDILTAKIESSHLRIEPVDGVPRLVVDHPRRGKTLYDTVNGLSDGERVRFAIDELLPRLPTPALFPLPQRTYQDLEPADRVELSRYAGERGIYLFGAQVTEGELKVRHYDE